MPTQIENLKKTLEDIGLSPNEAAVYLAALKLGSSTVLDLSRESRIKRTTVYSVVAALQSRGLIVRELHGWKTKFVAESPDKLEVIIESRREELKRALPELSSLYNLKGEEGSIRFYDGLESVKSVYEDLLRDVRPHEDYLILSDLEQWHKLDANFFQKFIEKRAKLPIKIRMLTQKSEIALKHKMHEKAYNEKIRFLPDGAQLTTNLVIIPRRVVIQQLVPPVFALTIENKSIVKMHQEQFEIMWKAAE